MTTRVVDSAGLTQTGNVRRSNEDSFLLRSPSGPQVTLDGCKALIRLESGAGDRFEMGPDSSLLHTVRDLTIEAPGRTITIRAAHVEFERA